MSQFCDVALPVPLEMTFTYRVNGQTPVVGGRVLVPFRTARLPGVVTALHDQAPRMEAKTVHSVIDAQPLIDAPLMRLAEWISSYYIAPIGEVLRSMLPLQAEVRRDWIYAITEAGQKALHDSAQSGNSGRSRKSIDEQMHEYQVLDYLLQVENAHEQTLRNATGATRDILRGLQANKWITRQDVSSTRDAIRKIKVAHLIEGAKDGPAPKLNPNQQAILDKLKAAGGRAPVDELNKLEVPRTTIATLVRRQLVRIEETPVEFHVTSIPAATQIAREHLNPPQEAALDAVE